jgi:20S proteasome subunit beta 2
MLNFFINKFNHNFCFRYHGYISAACVLGGVDSTGPHLYSVYPHGSTDKLPYVTMGLYLLFMKRKFKQ